MPLLTVEDYRELVTTSASDEAIQIALDANEALLNRVLGELGVDVLASPPAKSGKYEESRAPHHGRASSLSTSSSGADQGRGS